MKAHRRDDADNFARDIAFLVVAGIDHQPFADRVLARKIFVHHRLIDNDDPRRIFRVALVQCSTAQQWRFECRKIIACDDFEIGAQHVCRRRLRRAIAPESSLPSTHERSVRADSNILHAGQRAHFVEERFREDVNLVAVVVFSPWQFKARCEERTRFVA